MVTADLFWKLFEQTGSIQAYLAYRILIGTAYGTL
ncbi:YqzL family protein [Selenihalanaerobacter shriftii]|nr:YqzL family protein [Selenihalanaerobacter shriftii]